MSARCHNDSCTVKWSEVSPGVGLLYQADVDLDSAAPGVDSTPTLRCGDNGIEVMLSDNPGQILESVEDGLFASLPAAIVETLSGNPDNKPVGPGADSGSTQSSDTYTWTNTTGRDALVLVSGEFNFDYGIAGPTHAFSYAAGTGERAGSFASGAYNGAGAGAPANALSPFNAMVAMRLLGNVGAPPTTARKATRVDIGGLINVSNPASCERKTTRVPFFWMVRVASGATLNMKSDAFFEGPSQTVNVLATPSAGTGLAGTGHELWNLQVSAVPI